MCFLFYIDSIPPSVAILAPDVTANYSQIVSFRANVSDLTSGVSFVIFNLTSDSNSAQSTNVTANLQNGVYSILYNTTQISEGYYNVSVVATDLLGNRNNSVSVHRILFDNTAPSVTHSCDDLTVTLDDDITCTCTASDSLSGLNLTFGNNGVSFTVHPSTSSTGNNKETTCTAEDTAANRRVSIIYYNVTSNSNNNGGGNNNGNSGTSGTSGGSPLTNTNNNSSTANNSTGSNSTQTNLSDANTITGNALFGNQGNDATPEQKARAKKIFFVSTVVIVLIVIVLLGLKKMIRFIKTKKLHSA